MSKHGWFTCFCLFVCFCLFCCFVFPKVSKGYSTWKIVDFTFFRNFCEIGPSSKDFLAKRDPCLRILGKKVTHLAFGWHIPYTLTCEYLPGTERNRPYKIPWPSRELNCVPTAQQARTLPVCHTTPFRCVVIVREKTEQKIIKKKNKKNKKIKNKKNK